MLVNFGFKILVLFSNRFWAEVKSLQNSIAEQSAFVQEQKEEIQKLSNIHSEVEKIKHSLNGGTEFVEGFIVIRSNQEMVLLKGFSIIASGRLTIRNVFANFGNNTSLLLWRNSFRVDNTLMIFSELDSFFFASEVDIPQMDTELFERLPKV